MRTGLLAAAVLGVFVMAPRTAHARYLMAQTANFLQPDQAGINAGPNLYEYVQDNPTNLTDPSGNSPWGYSMVASSDPATLSELRKQADMAFVKAIEFEESGNVVPIYKYPAGRASGPLVFQQNYDWSVIGFTPVASWIVDCNSGAQKSGETPKDGNQNFDFPYSYIYTGYINSHPHGPWGVAATMLHEWVHQSIIKFVHSRHPANWTSSADYDFFWNQPGYTNNTLGGAVSPNASELFAYTIEYQMFPGETPAAVIK